MKKLILILLNFCIISPFISNGQERNDEVRQKLQVSMEAQSEKLANIKGWSKIENQEGKFWKQSDSNTGESYLPCCPNYSFSFLQMFKFKLEGENFYLFAIYFPSYGSDIEASVRHFVLRSSSFQKLQNIITSSDGKYYGGAEIEYGDVRGGRNLDPDIAIKNKEMIRCLLLGEKPSPDLKGMSIFNISSQILKGDTLVRFTFLIGGSSDLEGDRNRMRATGDEDYFELKKKDFTKLFKFTPFESETKYIKQGEEKSERKDYAGAVSEYTNAIRLNPNNPSSYNSRGIAKYYLEDNSGAIEDFSKSIELSPKEKAYNGKGYDLIASYYMNRGRCKLERKDYNGVLEDVTKAGYWHAPTERNYFLSGRANYLLENYKAAVNDYSKIIILNPQSLDAYYYRADTKNKLEDFYGALLDCNKAIEIDSNYAQAYSMRAATKNYLQDYSGAITDSDKALEIDPNYGGALNHKGFAKIKIGQKESGCADLSKSVELGYEKAKELLSQYCK
jgi:tetratricopeptide (TPR) repeat protein